MGFLDKLSGKKEAPPPPRRTAQAAVRQPGAAAAPRPARTSEGGAAGDGGRPPVMLAGLRFSPDEIESDQGLAKIHFSSVINDKIRLGAHLYSRIAVLQISANDKRVVLVVDKAKATSDDIAGVVTLLTNQQFVMVEDAFQGFFAVSSIVISLSQGHITADGLKAAREIARDPNKNSLMSTFIDIVAWAYANKADDIDWVVDQTSSRSQLAFKIGGRYIRPEMYNLPTDTVIQMLGIAWQKSGGGAAAQFSIQVEQQAKVELDLPRSPRIPEGARVRLRWSGMANDRGTVVTTRIQRLGGSAIIRSIEEAGYPLSHLNILKRVIRSEGGITTFAGVVGSGKSTSLAQLMGMLPHDIKCISIEDPVELEIPRMYQKTITRDLSASGEDPAFTSAVRAIYRSALDVLLLGEIRDYQTGLLARQVGESGHSVYTTTHARSALGVIDRFASPAIGIPRDVMASPGIMKLLVYQALLPVTCPHCGLTTEQHAHKYDLRGEGLGEHHRYFDRFERLFGVSQSKLRLRNPEGCDHCRKEDLPELNGLAGRTVVAEMVEPTAEMSTHIMTGNTVELYRSWRAMASPNYEDEDLTGKNTMECAVYKAAKGTIDPREIEGRFMAFETLEMQRKGGSEVAGKWPSSAHATH